ncbi:hypothetical protein I0292_26520 (plasmid) [Priestia megaterium]|uniref:DUF6236 family protein n=1 Tax=Priestia megaterium TaxID=1404 RepID=UPI00206D05E0|nr:DUF6236 family protein [Priestia megaterium]UOO43805.1 hypothetical protein I0292_26520 [Priestia megaterium]
MSNALYFPKISIPETPWTLQTLLYWNKIGTIVPSEFLENPYNLSPFMRSLVQEEMVEQIIPGQYIRESSFGDAFLAFIDNNNEIKRIAEKDKLRNTQRYIQIHLEKLSYVGEELIKRKLAWRGENNWFLVEETVGLRFMSYLAMVLGTKANFTPITDSYMNISSIISDTQRPRKAEQHFNRSKIRKRILKNILPTPIEVNHPLEILRFKEKYSDQLFNFRRYIEDFILELELIPEDSLEQKVSAFEERVAYEKEELSNRMRDRSWITLDFATLCAICPSTYQLFEGFASHDYGKVAQSIPGVIGPVWAATQLKKNEHPNSPLAYAVILEGKFNARK